MNKRRKKRTHFWSFGKNMEYCLKKVWQLTSPTRMIWPSYCVSNPRQLRTVNLPDWKPTLIEWLQIKKIFYFFMEKTVKQLNQVPTSKPCKPGDMRFYFLPNRLTNMSCNPCANLRKRKLFLPIQMN